MVVNSTPDDGAVNVDVSGAIEVVFSESMDTSSVVIESSPDAALGAPSWGFDDKVITLVPSAPLAWDTSYFLTIRGKDLAGNAMQSGRIDFSTASDPQPPEIVSTTPGDGEVDVATSTHLSMTFSKPMDMGSLVLQVSPAYDLGPATWNTEFTAVTFVAPPAELQTSTTYSVMVGGADTSRHPLASNTGFTFTTAAPPDTTPPTVTGSAPGAGSLGVPIDTSLSLTFDEPMNHASVEQAFSVTPAVACAFSWTGDTLVTCDPTANLGYSTMYTVTLGTGAQDVSGNPLTAAYSFGFTTASVPDTTPPSVVSLDPVSGAVGVPRNTNISVSFSEPMDKASAQAAFIISPSTYANGTFSWNSAGTLMVYDPPTDINYGTNVSVALSTGARDLAGNALSVGVASNFRIIRSASIFLESVPALDGRVSDDGGVDSTADHADVGDVAVLWNNYAQRGFVSFNLATLASNLTRINEAILYVYQTQMTGTPYPELGSLTAESVDYGPSLDSGDYNVSALFPRKAISADPSNGMKQVSMLTEVISDWSNRGSRASRSQFRLRFNQNDKSTDGNSDNVTIIMSEYGDGAYRPRLYVTYEYP